MNDLPIEEKNQMEAEANYFAMCLLMPEFLLRPDFERMKNGTKELPEIVAALAKRYKVDEAYMALRLGQIGVLKT